MLFYSHNKHKLYLEKWFATSISHTLHLLKLRYRSCIAHCKLCTKFPHSLQFPHIRYIVKLRTRSYSAHGHALHTFIVLCNGCKSPQNASESFYFFSTDRRTDGLSYCHFLCSKLQLKRRSIKAKCLCLSFLIVKIHQK